VRSKIRPKNTSKNHEKTLLHEEGYDSIQRHSYIDANQEFTKCRNQPNILPIFGRLGRSLTYLLSSLRHEAHPQLAKMKT
jgi:hypothetical protein